MSKRRASAKKPSLDKRSWDNLTPNQKGTRNLVLQVMALVKNEDYSLTDAATLVGIGRETVLRHAGGVFTKKAGRYVARPTDQISVRMLMIENGKEVSVILPGSVQRSKIGEYYSAIGHYIETGDSSRVGAFEGVSIPDIYGVHHAFETNLDRIRKVEEARVNRDDFSLYDSGS